MKISYQAVLLSAMALALGACSEDNPWQSDGEGGISLRLSASADVKDAIPMLRADAPALEAPSPSDFSISLKNLVTEEVKTWATLSDFQNQKSFPTGSYTLTAFYGDADEEGFEKPYFVGTADVTVLESREANVDVTAQLANTMVSVDYTDAFRSYFKDYGVTVHSEGHSYVEFAPDETRPAFITPGEVSLAVKVTNPSGKTATIQPASFPAAPRYHYHITFDVNTGTSGTAQLQIIFDDSLTQEDVTIDLTDELFSSPAPKVTPSGFEDGQTIELLSGNAAANPLKFDVVAYGGMSSALLTISGDGFTPAFGNEVELIGASEQTQKQLADLGIKGIGFFKNPQNLASLDITGLAQHLPEGKFAVSLVVKDAYTRVSEPVTLNISTEPVVLNVSDGTAIFNSGQATLQVAYNGAEPEKNISFKALAKTGVYKDCQVLSVAESTRTRSFETKNYIFTISLPDTDHSEIPVKVFFGGVEKTTATVTVTVPDYSIEVDPFATYAKVKVSTTVPSDLAAVTNGLKLNLGGTEIAESQLTRNGESGMITIRGLEAATSYNLGAVLATGMADKSAGFTTEAATDLSNGNFEQSGVTIEHTKVQHGGNFRYLSQNRVVTATIKASEPTGWASVNAKTCWWDSSNKNTWYLVPSTNVVGGQAVLKNVAYDHAGSDLPNMSGAGASWYNTHTPTFTTRAAGELFLGEYSYDGSEHRTDGIAFSSRPTSVSFQYSYATVTEGPNDKGKVEVAVLDASGAVIASATAELDPVSSMTDKVVSLSGYQFGSKAAKIRVRFLSSNSGAPTHTPTGSELSTGDAPGTWNFINVDLGENIKARATGSVLTLDNVKLNY